MLIRSNKAQINLYMFTGLHINVQITEEHCVNTKKLVAHCSNGSQFNAAVLLLSACYLTDVKQQINNLISA